MQSSCGSGVGDEASWRELAEQKEREWRCVQEKRIEVLESVARAKQAELTEERRLFAQLKADFKYNLRLLEERDAELDKLEQSLLATRAQLADRHAECSELRIALDEMRVRDEQAEARLDECKRHYVARLAHKQAEFDKWKSGQERAIGDERRDIERHKRCMHARVAELELELDTQRAECANEFEQAMRKREHEWQMQADEMAAAHLAKELEVGALTTYN